MERKPRARKTEPRPPRRATNLDRPRGIARGRRIGGIHDDQRHAQRAAAGFCPARFHHAGFRATEGHSLFKIVSVKDEVVIGLSADELSALGGNDAGAVAKALAAKGTLTVWQYAVRKAANGDLEQAPRQKIGLIAHDSLRVEPYATPLKVIAHE